MEKVSYTKHRWVCPECYLYNEFEWGLEETPTIGEVLPLHCDGCDKFVRMRCIEEKMVERHWHGDTKLKPVDWEEYRSDSSHSEKSDLIEENIILKGRLSRLKTMLRGSLLPINSSISDLLDELHRELQDISEEE